MARLKTMKIHFKNKNNKDIFCSSSRMWLNIFRTANNGIGCGASENWEGDALFEDYTRPPNDKLTFLSRIQCPIQNPALPFSMEGKGGFFLRKRSQHIELTEFSKFPDSQILKFPDGGFE